MLDVSGYLNVKQRAGHLPYSDDPKVPAPNSTWHITPDPPRIGSVYSVGLNFVPQFKNVFAEQPNATRVLHLYMLKKIAIYFAGLPQRPREVGHQRHVTRESNQGNTPAHPE